MNEFSMLNRDEMMEVEGGAVEILIAGKVLTDAAACGVIEVGGVALVGVAALAVYVASKN